MYITIAIVAVLAVWFGLSYNKFVSLVNRAKEAWADINVQLKRRYDLIPNLVNTVKGYATYEGDTFEKVTKARNMAMNATGLADKSQAENMLSGALKSLFALSEAYPALKANEGFLSLQSELSDTEDKIQAARRFYNGNVRDLNISLESFPSNIVGKIFNFQKMEFFQLEDEAAKNPVAVKF